MKQGNKLKKGEHNRFLLSPSSFSFIILFICISLFCISCKDESGPIGFETLSGKDLLQTQINDTLSLVTFTVKEDSIRSDETTLNLLGTYNDPVFGKSAAGFYTQLLLTGNNVDFGTNPVFDSIVLYLNYKGYYGDTTIPQTVKVFRLAEDISKDSTYYSNKTFFVSTKLGELAFVPRPNDSVLVQNNKTAPQLSIKLDSIFGKDLLHSGSSVLKDNSSFLQYLKGIYITTDDISASGAILYFDLVSSGSKMTLYYNDSLSYDFIAGDKAARINRFSHDYSGAPVSSQLSDSTLGSNLVYLQGMSGVITKIKMPYLKGLGKVSVNKAELIIKLESASTVSFLPPAKLLLARIDSVGKVYTLTDEYAGSTYFGGSYNSAIQGYSFNLAYHIQDILNGRISDYGLYLLPAGAAVNANRAVIGGGKNATFRMKLNLTVTKL